MMWCYRLAEQVVCCPSPESACIGECRYKPKDEPLSVDEKRGWDSYQLDIYQEAARLKADNEGLCVAIGNFDAAIRRIAVALTGKACGGVDTGHEINPETGEPYGPGGHTGWLLADEAKKLVRERDALLKAIYDAKLKLALNSSPEGISAAYEILRLASIEAKETKHG